MICSHCGKVLDNEKLAFCVYCGYPLKGSNKGFFAKSEETGYSRAEEMAKAEAQMPALPEMPALEEPPRQSAPAPAVQPAANPQPVPNVQPVPQMNAAAPMNGVMPAQPVPQMGNVQPMMQSPVSPMGVQQPVMQQPVSPMGMQQPMMQNMPGMAPAAAPMGMMPGMPAQPAMQGSEMAVMPQMPYGMPAMGYMPQMQYGMPQFAGYDAAGNPIYMQMVPQLIGYDAYGNPLYNMTAVPYVMPAMQGMPAPPPMQPVMNPVYPQEAVIDVPQEQIRPAEPMQPKPQAAPVQPQPVQPAPVQAQVQPTPVQSAPISTPPPAQSIQAATQAIQEALRAVQGAEPVQQPPVERSVTVSSAEDIPMDAASLMEEDASQKEGIPDEKAILDSIFSDAPKSYTMSEGTKPSAATFSISLSASEIISVRDEEAPAPDPKTAKKQAAPKAEKPEKKAAAKEEKPAPKKKTKKQSAPATIVSPDAFFDDKPRGRRDTLSAKDLDKLDDEQLAAHLASMQSTTGGKKSTRSMKAASREEMDISNIEADALLGPMNSGLPH